MSSDQLAVAVSDPITNTRPSVPDESTDDAPTTKRLGAFDLAFALAAMEFVTDEEEAHDEEKEDEPPKRTSGDDASRELFANAFRLRAAQRPDTDDEPTLEVPSPPLPPGLPSPLGDDDTTLLPATDDLTPFETLTIRDLGLDLDGTFPLWAEATSIRDDGEPSGIRDRVIATSEASPPTSAARTPLEAAELHVRRAVIASWTIAIAMAGFCTYMLTTT